MTPGLLLGAILPLIAFVIVDAFAGPKAGIFTSIGFAIAWLMWSYHIAGDIDFLSLIEVGLIVSLGALSIKLRNSTIFKYQPVVVALTLALFVTAMNIFGEPIMLRMMPKIIPLLPEPQQNILKSPESQMYFRQISFHMPILFLAHAALVYWAVKKSNWKWLLTRLAIFPMTIIFIAIEKVIMG